MAEQPLERITIRGAVDELRGLKSEEAWCKSISFQKIVQIEPDVAIAITGNGSLRPNLERAEKYRKYLNSKLYVISLKQRKYQKFERQ